MCVRCHQVLDTASLCSPCVEAQEPIPTCEDVHLHQRQTPNQRSQELVEGSLGGFAICCPLCPFEHIHLLLASPGAAAGVSHGITGIYCATILFSLPSCLSACGLAWLCFLQHPSLKDRLHAKVSLHLREAPLLCCLPTVPEFLAPLVICQ